MTDNTVSDLIKRRDALYDRIKELREMLRVFKDKIMIDISSLTEDISVIEDTLSKMCRHVWEDINPDDYRHTCRCTICGTPRD